MSFLKTLGKVGLKIAPYAALAIPGVGPLAAAGIQAGIGAAQSKAGGGSWGDALKNAGVSGALSYVPGGKEGAGKVANTGVKGFLKQTGKNVLKGEAARTGIGAATKGIGPSNSDVYISDDPRKGGIIGNTTPDVDYTGVLSRILGGGNANTENTRVSPNGNQSPTDAMNRSRGWATNANYEGNMRGLGPVMGRRDQNFPNLAESIGAGRQNAIRDQPFRQGYDVITHGPEPTDDTLGNVGPEIRTRMPTISPTGKRRRMN